MKIYKFPTSYVKWNYAYISLRFQARKQETKRTVKRDKRKEEHGVKTNKKKIFKQETLSIILNGA